MKVNKYQNIVLVREQLLVDLFSFVELVRGSTKLNTV
jgi:hypothetical protein